MKKRSVCFLVPVITYMSLALFGCTNRPATVESDIVTTKSNDQEPDSAYLIYAFRNDSIMLFTGKKLVFTTISQTFGDTVMLNRMKKVEVLIKPTPGCDYQIVTDFLVLANKHKLPSFAMVEFREGELDFILKHGQ